MNEIKAIRWLCGLCWVIIILWAILMFCGCSLIESNRQQNEIKTKRNDVEFVVNSPFGEFNGKVIHKGSEDTQTNEKTEVSSPAAGSLLTILGLIGGGGVAAGVLKHLMTIRGTLKTVVSGVQEYRESLEDTTKIDTILHKHTDEPHRQIIRKLKHK